MTTNPIIDTPSLQSLRLRMGYTTLTACFWALWFYLFLPLLSLIAWLFEIQLIHREFLQLNGYSALAETAGLGLACLVVLGGGLISWATINQHRFKNKTRRGRERPVSIEQLARCFNLSAADVARIQESKFQAFHHDEDGEVVHAVQREKGPLLLEDAKPDVPAVDRTSREQGDSRAGGVSGAGRGAERGPGRERRTRPARPRTARERR